MMGLFLGLNLPSAAQSSSVDPFMGMWALTLDYEDNSAGWLEVRQEDGYLDSEMLWRWGSVLPVDYTLVNENQLILVNGRDEVRERDEQSNPIRTTHPVNWFQVTKTGDDQLEGWAYFPNKNGIGVEAVGFSGKRIPAYGETPKIRKIKYGNPKKLFNGKDLKGWELLNKSATNGWKVEDGILNNDPLQKQGEVHINSGTCVLRTPLKIST